MDLAHALARGGGNSPRLFTARLLDVDDELNRAHVSIYESEPVWLPFVPNVYEGVTTVYVLHNLILGPCYEQEQVEVPPAPAPVPPPPAEQSADQQVETVTAVIRPTWSGTYRHIRGDWDRWNVGRYGGRSTLYQGSAYGSGQLTGLAVYGSQVAALGALEITALVVSTPLATGGGTVTLQGSSQGSAPSGAPTSSGTTATGDAKVALSADVREGFRTGVLKGLATVGGTYRATYGAARASGMSLAITYKRPR